MSDSDEESKENAPAVQQKMMAVVCMGTKTVDIKGGRAAGQGLVTVLREGTQRLEVIVTDGLAVYQTDFSVEEQVKMKLLEQVEPNQRAELFAGYLLHKTSDCVQATYVYQQEENPPGSIQLLVKYLDAKNVQDQDGIKKKALSVVLRQNNSDNNNTMLTLAKTLGDGVNQGQQRIEQLQDRVSAVEQERESWKNTAEKLEGAWQSEKDTLFENFVNLYNKTREELQGAREQVQKLQKQLADQGGERPAKRAKATRQKQPANEEINQPDDIDDTVFGSEMVDALAAAKPVSLKRSRGTEKATTKGRKKPPATQKAKVKAEPADSDQEGAKKPAAAAKKVKQEPPPSPDSDDSDRKEIRSQLLAAQDSSDEEEERAIL